MAFPFHCYFVKKAWRCAWFILIYFYTSIRTPLVDWILKNSLLSLWLNACACSLFTTCHHVHLTCVHFTDCFVLLNSSALKWVIGIEFISFMVCSFQDSRHELFIVTMSYSLCTKSHSRSNCRKIRANFALIDFFIKFFFFFGFVSLVMAISSTTHERSSWMNSKMNFYCDDIHIFTAKRKQHFLRTKCWKF